MHDKSDRQIHRVFPTRHLKNLFLDFPDSFEEKKGAKCINFPTFCAHAAELNYSTSQISCFLACFDWEESMPPGQQQRLSAGKH